MTNDKCGVNAYTTMEDQWPTAAKGHTAETAQPDTGEFQNNATVIVITDNSHVPQAGLHLLCSSG